MAHEKAPAYQWYVKDWRASRPAMRMSFAERGIFREMLDQQWEDLTLPDDPAEVAALVASTPAQCAEVIAAWPVVRRKFATVDGQPGRICNQKLEEIRRELRRFTRGAKKGGVSRASSASRREDGTFQPKSSSVPAATPADIQPGIQPVTSEPPAAHPASSSTAIATAIATATARELVARGGSVLSGSLPRDHQDHAACDATFSRCVPRAVHDKLANLLAPKYGGDRQVAKGELVKFYGTVWNSLPPDFVLGDAFRFWQGRFDQAFASKDTATARSFGKPEPQNTIPSVEETSALIRSLKEPFVGRS